MLKIIVLCLFLLSCHTVTKKKKTQVSPLSIINEEFREYQYVKDIWNIGEKDKSNSVKLSFQNYLDSTNLFETNYLNEVTKEKSDQKHVYYWEDSSYRFAIKLVVFVANDLDKVKIRWDHLRPPSSSYPNDEIDVMSYRLQSYYVLHNRKEVFLAGSEMHSASKKYLASIINKEPHLQKSEKDKLINRLKL